MMSQHERRRAAMSHAFRYQEYKAAVAQYVDSVLAMCGKAQVRGTPISSGHRSDPTARAAIKLAEMPEPIRIKELWVRAVNDTWRELRAEDKSMACLFEKNFHLTGDILGPEHNTAVRNGIVEELDISMRTFYSWLNEVTDVLVYHASRRKLL